MTNKEDKVSKSSFNWFPGHMTKAIREIKEQASFVDIVFEIRDARSPLVTGNQLILEQIGKKNRLIILNKMDLGSPKIIALWKDWFAKQNEPFIFINTLNKASVSQIIKIAREIVFQKNKQSNPDFVAKKNLKVMIVGLPNTGKSTLINKLAGRMAAKVADKPGQTQHQLWINAQNDLMILDTPGVMPHSIASDEHVLWLSALHAIPEGILENQNTVCYITEHLLKYNPEIFHQYYGIPDATPRNIEEIMNAVAKVRGCLRGNGQFDFERVYKILINDFRNGSLGPVHLGLPPSSPNDPDSHKQ